MKKILAALILGSLASLSFAQESGTVTVCEGGTAVSKAVPAEEAPNAGEPDERFIKTNFTFNCSSNSILVYTEQSPTLLTVGAASVKGSEYFGGHTDGGSVKSYGPCAAKDCIADDATNGETKALEEADGEAGGGGGSEPPPAG